MKVNKIRFVIIIMVSYILAYLVAGGIAYQLITKQFYVGNDAVFTAYLRSEADAAQWTHASAWLFPVLAVRALLFGAVLLPFMSSIIRYTYKRRALILSAVVFILMHMAAAAPSPSNLEGFVYMRSELFTLKTFLLTQPEMIAQSLVFGILVSWAIGRFMRAPSPTTRS